MSKTGRYSGVDILYTICCIKIVKEKACIGTGPASYYKCLGMVSRLNEGERVKTKTLLHLVDLLRAFREFAETDSEGEHAHAASSYRVLEDIDFILIGREEAEDERRMKA